MSPRCYSCLRQTAIAPPPFVLKTTGAGDRGSVLGAALCGPCHLPQVPGEASWAPHGPIRAVRHTGLPAVFLIFGFQLGWD